MKIRNQDADHSAIDMALCNNNVNNGVNTEQIKFMREKVHELCVHRFLVCVTYV